MLDVFIGNLPQFIYPPAFYHDGDNFLALPEETQQLLLKKGSDSDEVMHHQLEMLKMKE